MATTYNPAFKNSTINAITGVSSNGSVLYYVAPYGGAQTTDPTIAPASVVFTNYYNGPILGGFMSQPAFGISAMTGNPSAAAQNAITVTNARLYNSSGVAMIDVSASLAGGGGGMTFPTLSSAVAVGYAIGAFSMKVPLTNGGTVLINTALANAIANAWCISATNIGLGSSASINIYSGTAPATADAAATGTLLATFTTAALGASWNAASAGSAALVSPLTVAASATGTAGYVRIVKGTYVLQGSVGTTGTDFIINSTSLVSTVNVILTDATIAY